MGLSDDSVIM